MVRYGIKAGGCELRTTDICAWNAWNPSTFGLGKVGYIQATMGHDLISLAGSASNRKEECKPEGEPYMRIPKCYPPSPADFEA